MICLNNDDCFTFLSITMYNGVFRFVEYIAALNFNVIAFNHRPIFRVVLLFCRTFNAIHVNSRPHKMWTNWKALTLFCSFPANALQFLLCGTCECLGGSRWMVSKVFYFTFCFRTFCCAKKYAQSIFNSWTLNRSITYVMRRVTYSDGTVESKLLFNGTFVFRRFGINSALLNK